MAAFTDIAVAAGLMMIALAIAIAFIRLWRGPTLADRVVALDMMTAALIGFSALYAVHTGVQAWLDIALALALVSFVSVLAFARLAISITRKGDAPEQSGDQG